LLQIKRGDERGKFSWHPHLVNIFVISSSFCPRWTRERLQSLSTQGSYLRLYQQKWHPELILRLNANEIKDHRWHGGFICPFLNRKQKTAMVFGWSEHWVPLRWRWEASIGHQQRSDDGPPWESIFALEVHISSQKLLLGSYSTHWAPFYYHERSNRRNKRQRSHRFFLLVLGSRNATLFWKEKDRNSLLISSEWEFLMESVLVWNSCSNNTGR